MNPRTFRNSLLIIFAAAVLALVGTAQAASTADPVGDALTSDSDFNQLDASHTATDVVVKMYLETLLTSGVHDPIEYLVIVNGQTFGICYLAGTLSTWDWDNGVVAGSAVYDFGAATITFTLPISALDTPTIPADVHAISSYGECLNGGQIDDDRVPDAGTISTAAGSTPPPPPTSSSIWYFKRGALGVGNVDLINQDGPTLDDVAPTAAEPAVTVDVSGVNLYNGILTPTGPRSIYDGNWLSVDDLTFSGDELVVTWYATVAGSQAGLPGDWYIDLYSYDGTSYTLLAANSQDMSVGLGSGVIEEKTTFTGISMTAKKLLVYIQGFYPVNDPMPTIYYDSVDYPSNVECTTCAGTPPPPPPPGGGTSPGFYVEANGAYEAFVGKAAVITGVVSGGMSKYDCEWQKSDADIFFKGNKTCVTSVVGNKTGTYVLVFKANDSTPLSKGGELKGSDTAVFTVRWPTEEENETMAEKKALEKNPPTKAEEGEPFPDEDEDGIDDRFDHCLGKAGGAKDSDSDGYGDACDPDLDGDGILNGRDNCPDVPNPFQQDTDGNGRGDACEADADKDGWSDALDNCPTIPNAVQADMDYDGIGNVCDGDVDGDGVKNDKDAFPFDRTEWSDLDGDRIGDNRDLDIDGDGYTNALEIQYGSNPRDRNSVPEGIAPDAGKASSTQSVDSAASAAGLSISGMLILVLVAGLVMAVVIVMTRKK